MNSIFIFAVLVVVGNIAIAAEVVATTSPSILDSILSLLTRPETLTALATIIAAIVPMVGLPAWATAIITGAAGVAVPYIEQTSKADVLGVDRKVAAEKAVREMLPIVIRALPGTARKIDKAIEAKVYDLNF